jgi:hypothetical protein
MHEWCVYHAVSRYITYGLKFQISSSMRIFALYVLIYLLSIVSIEGIQSGAVIENVKRFAGELRWGSNVTITQEPGTVVLMLLVSSEHRGYEPCLEFGPMCCIGVNLRTHVWGGDVEVLQELKNSCEMGMGDVWESVLEPLSDRSMTQIGFSMNDIRDPARTGAVFDGIQDVRVLTLVVQRWAGCDGGINNKCVIRLEGFEKIMRVDISSAQQVSSVTLVEHCTSGKPPNSFWLPSSDPSVCEWFCDTGFSRCPGYGVDSSAQTCYMLPQSGATMRVTVAITISPPLHGQALDSLSSDIARRFRDAGVLGCEQCAVILQNKQNESSVLTRVNLPVVKGRIRVVSQSHYDGVALREQKSTDTPNEPIPIELDDTDDRFLPGFVEITLLVYSNNTIVSLATQAVLFRYVVFDALRAIEGASVLYVSDVEGVMRGRLFQEFSISWIQVILLCCWGGILAVLFVSSVFCPWRCTSGAVKDRDAHGSINLPPTQFCGEHSPRDRILLTGVFIGIVGIIPTTVFLYMVFVLPPITSSGNVMNPFMMLGWLWCMIIVWILATIGFCCVARFIRRSV